MPSVFSKKRSQSDSTTQSKRLRFLRWAIPVAVFVVAVAIGAVIIFSKPATTTQTITRDVQVGKVTMTESVSTTGTIEPQQRADLSFSSSGTIKEVSVSVGDKVTTGQALASIDLTDLKAAVDSAKASVDAAKSDYTTAVDSGVDAQIKAAKSALAVKKNTLANAKTALAAGTLVAPFDGTVAIVSTAVGDTVNSGSSGGSGNSAGGGMIPDSSSSSSAAITIITADKYSVTTSVGSSDVMNIAKDQKVEVTPNGSSERLAGTVSSVGLIASSSGSSGATFPVTIDITDIQNGLYSGVSAAITIITSSKEVLAVPTAAITINPDQATVELKNANGTTTTTPVTIGQSSDSMTEVATGLSEGDTVVITIQITSSSNDPNNPLSSILPGGGGGPRQIGGGPQGLDPGQMPEGFTPGQRPEGFEQGQRPEGFDRGQMPSGGPVGG